MKHFVLNRFNLQVYGKSCCLKEDWLQQRLVLYNDCLSSLANQTNKDFIILLHIHPETPEHVIKSLKGMYKQYELEYEFLFAKKWPEAAQVLKDCLAKHKRVITSRLDTDDMYPVYYIERIKAAIPDDKGIVCIDFKKLIYSNGKKNNLYKYPNNTMFLSICSSNPAINCSSQSHINIKKIKGVRRIFLNEIGGKIIVHGNNVSNVMRGKKTEMSLSDIFK